MNRAIPSLSQMIRIQALATNTWHKLRTPWLLLASLVSLSAILILTYLISQPYEAGLAPTVQAESLWIDTLPTWLRPAGATLFFLGFAHLMQSLWFWLPAALLLLHSLIVLADYGPGSYRRWRQTIPSLNWQHPLARRCQQTVRLPDTPEELLHAHRRSLAKLGFSLQESNEGEQRIISARQRGWAWLGPLIFYAGVFILVLAFLISHFSLEREFLTLSSLRSNTLNLLNGTFRVTQAEADRRTVQVSYQPNVPGAIAGNFSWRLYRPVWLEGVLILPTALEPLLTVEVRDETGSLLEITPLREKLATTRQLTAGLPQAEAPLLFSMPDAALAFQISPSPDPASHSYRLQVRQGVEARLIQDVELPLGRPVTIDDSRVVTISLNYNLKLEARRDPGLWLYLTAMVLLLAGAAIFFFWPPAQIWLIPEVKGRGGHLYGVLETFWPALKHKKYLSQLLVGDKTDEV